MSSGSYVFSQTPIERYESIYVKRDDRCCDSPRLAKIRGIQRFVLRRPNIRCFGILDGRHSRNGWALARVCIEEGRRAVVFWPQRLDDRKTGWQGPSRDEAETLGATIVPIQAGRSAVVFSQASKWMEGVGRLIPNAVKIPETVEAIADEVGSQSALWRRIKPKTVVMACGTGTTFAGVIKGFHRIGVCSTFCAVLGYSQSLPRLHRYVTSLIAPDETVVIRYIDTGLVYGSTETGAVPFPACSHYEAFAWNWLTKHRAELEPPILFWNAGD